MDAVSVLRELILIPGPPGEEGAVLTAFRRYVEGLGLGLATETDTKGNLFVPLGGSERPKVVVTAHLDEIAMIVRRPLPDAPAGASLFEVGALGGAFPWKFGEGPVLLLGDDEPVEGILTFGSIHTNDPSSLVRRADEGPIRWRDARVFVGGAAPAVHPGTRVVLHPARRDLRRTGPFVAGPFLDDRADLVAALLMLPELVGLDVLFVATASEETGGEGALFALRDLGAEVVIALELCPVVADAPIPLGPTPGCWASDSFAAMSAADGRLVREVGRELGMDVPFQALSRGGSDASIAASHGLVARPITLGLPMEGSHGFEIMHADAMGELARLAAALVRRIVS